MEEFYYHVESGQFSYNFRAPLLGDLGSTIKIYDFDFAENSSDIIVMRELTINKIDRESKCIECIGDIFE